MRKALAVSSREKKGKKSLVFFPLLSVLTYFIKGFAVMKATELFLLIAFVRRISNVCQDGLDGSQKHLTNCNRNCVTKILLPETHD